MGSVESVRAAGVVYLEDERVFVVGDRPRLFALDAVVLPGYPDLVSRVLYCPPSGWFFGSHGVYDHTGKARFGPAKYGMDRVAIAVADDIVYVNPEASMRGPLRRMDQDNSDVNLNAFCEHWGEGMNPEGAPGFVRRSFWRSS